ncbi:putative chalcone isomerase [Medicago truncatula]|uniref:Chalcone-flavonone isomerase family protein n=1 Tax=Medicago truncatula TaxID=3880 RepID=A0A396GWS5_MEDTR|nr:putative chalcone isomerase [Medicago truncatula]
MATPSVTSLAIESIVFPPTMKAPGSTNNFFLGGTGARGIQIQDKFVKFTAIGVYLQDIAVPYLAEKWKAKSAHELTDTVPFFRDIVTGPFEKFMRVTMIRPLTGQEYSNKVSENCVAIWKSLGIYTNEEIKAINKFVSVFKDETFPPGSSILFTVSPKGSGSLTVSNTKI